MSFVAVAVGAATTLYAANQQKKANQANINAMSDLASRPGQTALGTQYTPGGLSQTSPWISSRQQSLVGNLPGYKSNLGTNLNAYLGNLGNISNELGGPSFDNLYSNPNAFNRFGGTGITGVSAPTAPVRANFLSGQQPVFGEAKWSGYGNHFNAPEITGYTPGTFDQAGYEKAWTNYQNDLQAQADAQRAAMQAPVAQPSTPAAPSNQESAFMQAALNPIRQARADEYGRLSRDLGRRGVTGSSFANNAFGNLENTFGRTLSDATANVRQQQLQQQLGINDAAYRAATNYVNNLSTLDAATQQQLAQMAQQELGILGLSQAQIGPMINAAGLGLQNTNNYWDQIGRGVMGVGGMLAQNGSGGWNPFGNNTPYTPMHNGNPVDIG